MKETVRIFCNDITRHALRTPARGDSSLAATQKDGPGSRWRLYIAHLALNATVTVLCGSTNVAFTEAFTTCINVPHAGDRCSTVVGDSIEDIVSITDSWSSVVPRGQPLRCRRETTQW